MHAGARPIRRALLHWPGQHVDADEQPEGVAPAMGPPLQPAAPVPAALSPAPPTAAGGASGQVKGGVHRCA